MVMRPRWSVPGRALPSRLSVLYVSRSHMPSYPLFLVYHFKNMFRFLLSILVVFLSLTVLSSTFAADPECNPTWELSAGQFLSACSNNSVSKQLAVGLWSWADKDGVKQLVVKIAERVLQFGALFAIGAIVWSGIKYTTSAGDDEQTKSAKNTLIYAIVGLLLLLTAFPLVDIIVRFIYSFGT